VTGIIEDRGRGFLIEIGEELSRLRADLAQRTAERNALKAANTSLAGDAVGLRIACAALKAERDEARRSACMFKALYMDPRIGFSPMTDNEVNAEARKIAARMRWDCFDAKEAKP
jgi:hypothetical protein